MSKEGNVIKYYVICNRLKMLLGQVGLIGMFKEIELKAWQNTFMEFRC